MSRRGIGIVVLLLAAIVLRNTVPYSPAAQRMWKSFALPFRIARLSMEEPDTRLAIPVEGVTKAGVRDTWGAPRPGDRLHEGQDLFAPHGTPVLAATRGVVVRVGENRLGGNIVMVIGPGRRSYYYAHLDRAAEELGVGDVVAPGDLLGYVGNTGNARTTPAHLHFGVYGPDGALNPYPLLGE